MKKENIGLAAATIFSTSLILAIGSHTASAQDVTGEVLVPLDYVAGLKEDGSLDDTVTKACEKKYEAAMGKEVFVEYTISENQNKASALVEDTEVKLTPLVIPDTYSFTSDLMPDLLRAKGYLRVIFTMEDDFNDEVVHIIAEGDKSTDKCFLSTQAFRLRQ